MGALPFSFAPEVQSAIAAFTAQSDPGSDIVNWIELSLDFRSGDSGNGSGSSADKDKETIRLVTSKHVSVQPISGDPNTILLKNFYLVLVIIIYDISYVKLAKS